MSNPKRHHWVPKSILKYFENEEGQLYYCDKRHPRSPIESRNRRTVFRERNAYTLLKEDGTNDYSMEHKFAEIFDDKIGELIHRRLILSFSGLHCRLSSRDRSFLLSFYINLLARNPQTQSFCKDLPYFGAIRLVMALRKAFGHSNELTIEAHTK